MNIFNWKRLKNRLHLFSALMCTVSTSLCACRKILPGLETIPLRCIYDGQCQRLFVVLKGRLRICISSSEYIKLHRIQLMLFYRLGMPGTSTDCLTSRTFKRSLFVWKKKKNPQGLLCMLQVNILHGWQERVNSNFSVSSSVYLQWLQLAITRGKAWLLRVEDWFLREQVVLYASKMVICSHDRMQSKQMAENR